MHAGTLDENGNHQTKSKTEAMFIPAHPMTQEDIDAATTDIVFGTQYVPFTQEFQYFGSRVTTDLKDVTDINNRLRQAKGQAAALGTFFHSTADTWSKQLIFLAIPVNTALYGAESWTLNVELCRRISSFYHTTIRRIIGSMLWNIRSRMSTSDPTRLPRKFLTAWVSHPRRSGGQHYTLRNSYVETLQHILPNIPDNGTIDSWLPLAQNREQWKTLGTEWIKHRQALTIYQYGPHPLLGDGILDHQFFWYLQDIHRRFSMNDGHV
jgi:hypothetical protein